MTYTIGDIAQKIGLTPSTLRYYDKEGLLPFVDRTESGIRRFKDSDMEWLSIIECLKNTGMSIKEIKAFIDWCMEGDSSLSQRYELFLERKRETEKQIKMLQNSLDLINYKCWYYKTALDAGTEQIHKALPADRKKECPYVPHNHAVK
ncbi:MerR family transcriptional regulator [Clostridium sp. chh4-2]|uniref:MerR family transcriptional regulator n=1 Tax=Clostridium sp. chh4-2 TaxID=2067550 RepID=UPI000CCDF9FA|nr:MerR family transcriptional regulator [Clostridium sp. chh4-2]PNV60390.1 MerR family transcriptional regulator [Clostridium sp. chh4-2]